MVAKNRTTRLKNQISRLSYNVFTYTLVLTLAYSPLIPYSTNQAQADSSRPIDITDDPLVIQNQGVDGIQEMIQGLGQTYSNHRSNLSMMQQQAAMTQSLRPQTEPARFFPQCQMPTSPSFPEGACNSPIQDPQQLGMIESLRQGALQQKNFYESMLNESHQNRVSAGLQCIEDAKNQTNIQLQQRINGLQALIDQIKKQNQLFRDENQKLINEMQDEHSLLTGSQGRSDLDSETENFADRFSPDCQNIMAENSVNDINNTMRSSGFIGLQQGLADERGKSTDFLNNRSSIINDVNQSVQHIQNIFQQHGVQPAEGESIEDFTGRHLRDHAATRSLASTLANPVMSKVVDINERRNRAQSRLQDIGVNTQIPTMDDRFSERVGDFKEDIRMQFRQEYNECMRGQGSMANEIGISESEILSSLEHDNFRGESPPAVQRYREALLNILNSSVEEYGYSEGSSDDYVDSLLQKIQELDRQYDGRIKVEFRDTNSRITRLSPSQFYRNTRRSCNQRFDIDERVSIAKREYNELQNKHQTFLSEVGNDISDKVLNCEGRDLQSGPDMCSGTMETSSPNFCVKHATQCANKVNSCYGEVDKIVKSSQEKIENISTQYNANVQSFVASQEQLLGQIKSRLLQDQEMIRQFFPGADFELEGNLFVSMPEMVDEFGVELRGGSNFLEGGLDELANRVNTLKNQLVNQANRVQDVIAEYKSTQRDQFRKDRSRWDQLAESCQQVAAQFRDSQMKQHRDAQEKFQKASQEVGDFCNRFERLASMNPNAACNGFVGNLFDTSLKVSGHISGDAKHVINEFNNYCESQNERSPSSTESSNIPSDIIGLCEDNDDWEIGVRKLASNLARQIDGVSAEDIYDYSRGREPASITAEIRRDYGNVLEVFEDIHQASLGNTLSDSYDGLIEQVCDDDDDCQDNVRDNTNQDDYSGDNFCNKLELEARVKAIKSMDGDTQIARIEENMKAARRNLVRNQYSSANQLISKVHEFSGQGRMLASSSAEDFNSLGEHARMTSCQAQATPQRGMQQSLQMFDQMTGGDHAVGAPGHMR